MDPVRSAIVEPALGLIDNANRGGRRQVTIISRERWIAISETLGVQLDPSIRRANLMISGLELAHSRGRVVKIGSARLLINGETRPCERMEEAYPGLQAAMRERWGGGAFAEVLGGGEIRVGDVVGWDL